MEEIFFFQGIIRSGRPARHDRLFLSPLLSRSFPLSREIGRKTLFFFPRCRNSSLRPRLESCLPLPPFTSRVRSPCREPVCRRNTSLSFKTRSKSSLLTFLASPPCSPSSFLSRLLARESLFRPGRVHFRSFCANLLCPPFFFFSLPTNNSSFTPSMIGVMKPLPFLPGIEKKALFPPPSNLRSLFSPS